MIKLASDTWKRVRLITVKLSSPNRKGDRSIQILSNVPSHVKGTQIANAYRGRWTIETCLGYLSQSLNAEVKTLCYPAAAGMCFSVALLLFNIMSSLKTMLEKHAVQVDPDKPIEVSYYYMAVEIKSHIASMNLILTERKRTGIGISGGSTVARCYSGNRATGRRDYEISSNSAESCVGRIPYFHLRSPRRRIPVDLELQAHCKSREPFEDR